MAVIYQIKKSPKADKNGKFKYYPSVKLAGKLSTAQLAKEIAAYSSLTPGDVKNVLENLVVVMTTHMQASKSVMIDGLGSFQITLKTKPGCSVETPEEVSFTQATPKVRFRPQVTRHENGNVTRALVTDAEFVTFDKKKKTADGNNDDTPSTGGGDDNDPGFMG
jgi:predicted histone-like DNA-binding protein